MRAGCYREELWSSRGEVKRECFSTSTHPGWHRKKYVCRLCWLNRNIDYVYALINIIVCVCFIVIFVHLARSPPRWRRCSSHICSRWNPVFQHLDSSRCVNLFLLSGTWSPWCDCGGSPCKHIIMHPSEDVVISLIQWQPRRLRWRMLLSVRSRCFRRALSSERRYGCLANANFRGIAAYTQQDPSCPHTDHHRRRGGRYRHHHHHHHREGKGVTTALVHNVEHGNVRG